MSAVCIVSLGMALTVPSPAHAQSIRQALRQAYLTNPQLDASRALTRATDEGVSQANSGYRPRIEGTASGGWNRIDTKPPRSTPGESHPRAVGISLSQNIFDGFQTLNSVRVAEANVRAQRERLRDVEQRVLLAAARAYMDVVRDQAIVTLQENNVRVLTNQLKATQDQFSVGEVTRTDVAQAEARRSLAITELEQARSQLKSSRATYERVVGSPPGRLQNPGEPIQLMPRSQGQATGITQRENALIVEALYREQSARYDVDKIRGELLPTVSLGAAYERRFDTTLGTDQADDRSVTARMSVPIYAQGLVSSRVRQAKHVHVQRIQEIEQIRTEQIELTVQAWARYVAAKAQIRSAGDQVRANETALTGVREEYRVGQRTLLDVLNAELELRDSQVAEVIAKRNAVVEAYTLLQIIGRLNSQDLSLGVEIYDAEIHYFEVRRKWFGLSITYADGRHEVIDAAWEGHTHRSIK